MLSKCSSSLKVNAVPVTVLRIYKKIFRKHASKQILRLWDIFWRGLNVYQAKFIDIMSMTMKICHFWHPVRHFLFITEKFKFSFNSCCMKQVFLCCALIWKSSFFLYVHVFIYLKALQRSRFPYAFSQRCSVLVKCPHIPSFTQP